VIIYDDLSNLRLSGESSGAHVIVDYFANWLAKKETAGII